MYGNTVHYAILDNKGRNDSASIVVDQQDNTTGERTLGVMLLAEGGLKMFSEPVLPMMVFSCSKDGKIGVAVETRGIRSGSSWGQGLVTFHFDNKESESHAFLMKGTKASKTDGQSILDSARNARTVLVQAGEAHAVWFDLLSAKPDMEEFNRECEATGSSSKEVAHASRSAQALHKRS